VILQSKEICKTGIILLSQTYPSILFYYMFLSTGSIKSGDFGDYKLCKDSGQFKYYNAHGVQLEKINTKFGVIKEIKKDTNEKIRFGACLPEVCQDILLLLQDKQIMFNQKKYIIKVFPKQDKNTENKNYFETEITTPSHPVMSLVLINILFIYIIFIIALNILMRFFNEHINPFDIKEVKLHQHHNVIAQQLNSFSKSEESQDEHSQMRNNGSNTGNNLLLKSEEIMTSDIINQQTSHSIKAKFNSKEKLIKNEEIINEKNKPLYDNELKDSLIVDEEKKEYTFIYSPNKNINERNNSNSTIPHENEKFNKLNRFKKIYYQYFNLSNNMFLLTKPKCYTYNDSKIRFVNGLLLLFAAFHVINCTMDLLRILSKDEEINKYFPVNNSSLTWLIDKFLFIYGYLYLEILATIWGFLIAFKFLHVIPIHETQKWQKLIFWFLRNFDKFIVFIIFNLFFVYCVDYFMVEYKPESILWYLYQDKVKNCSYLNYMPFNDFYFLLNGKDIECLNTNRIYYQGLYIIIFSFILLRYLIESKKKMKILVYSFFATTTLRTLFTVLYLNSYMDDFELINVPCMKIIDFLHSQFFYNIPNAILGMIVGHVYYLDVNVITITSLCFGEYFDGFCKIRKFLVDPLKRNISYILAILIITFCGSISFFRDNIEQKWLNFFLISVNGILLCFAISVLILVVKLKGEEMWTFSHIIANMFKKIFKSNLCLIMYRCIHSVNLSHTALIYLTVLNMVINSFAYDFFNVIIIYGLPVCIVVFIFSFIVTIFIEIPIRTAMKTVLVSKTKQV
jgi:hypothetical protein